MTSEQRETLRLSLLRFLAVNPTQYGVPQTLLVALAKQEARPWVISTDVAIEMQYLEDKGLVARTAKPISTELPNWRITAAGRDFMAERGIE